MISWIKEKYSLLSETYEKIYEDMSDEEYQQFMNAYHDSLTWGRL